MSGSYIIARENFKEAQKHVSPNDDPIMFNLITGLVSLTEQIEDDFLALKAAFNGGAAKSTAAAKPAQKPAKKAAPRTKRAAKKKGRSR
jgi:hypothetical protein